MASSLYPSPHHPSRQGPGDVMALARECPSGRTDSKATRADGCQGQAPRTSGREVWDADRKTREGEESLEMVLCPGLVRPGFLGVERCTFGQIGMCEGYSPSQSALDVSGWHRSIWSRTHGSRAHITSYSVEPLQGPMQVGVSPSRLDKSRGRATQSVRPASADRLAVTARLFSRLIPNSTRELCYTG